MQSERELECRPGKRRKEKKRSLKKKKRMQQMGRRKSFVVCIYLSGVKTGKAVLFIEVSHPSAPYSSAPTDWE